jgi:uncharacterized protein (TIGR03085 family)
MSSNERHPILDERAALCDLMTELGPDAPTWCGDWTTRDLAAHLLVRETRPDAGPGLVVGGWFARHTERVRTSALERHDYGELVERLRSGPPKLALGGLKPDLDVHEWFVHHEDVRRPNGLGPRDDLGPLDEVLWTALARWGKLLTRRLDVGVDLATPDGRSHTARKGDVGVTLTAPPGELMLRLFGRPVDVELTGDAAAIERFESAELGV